ncbi:MAG: hypothetical protein R2697_04610 [Ilumatobacteraceae bacterium]
MPHTARRGLDTGGVYDRSRCRSGPTRPPTTCVTNSSRSGPGLVDRLAVGLGEPEPQQGETTYAAKIDPSELRIDWSSSAEQIHRLIRLGGAWTTFRGSRIKIHAAELVDGKIVPTVVQPEGKPRMDADAWRNGA